jgi:hypothetical protein
MRGVMSLSDQQFAATKDEAGGHLNRRSVCAVRSTRGPGIIRRRIAHGSHFGPPTSHLSLSPFRPTLR